MDSEWIVRGAARRDNQRESGGVRVRKRRRSAGPGSCLAFVTSYSHGLTNDRQLFLGLHINHTCRRSDHDSHPVFVIQSLSSLMFSFCRTVSCFFSQSSVGTSTSTAILSLRIQLRESGSIISTSRRQVDRGRICLMRHYVCIPIFS